jgi:regulator of sigma E protease
MNLLTTIVAFIIALGCLIVVHEFGHYIVARWCGVKVLRFSIGFGRPLWSRRLGRDGTEWAIAAFPLGGYVKMVDEREGHVEPQDLPRAFNRQSVARRFAIVLAGPLFNFILAIALYWVLFMHGLPGIRPIIGVVQSGTPAAQAGFVSGDTLTRIGREPVTTWQDARWMLLQEAVHKNHVQIEVRSTDGGVATRALDLSQLTAGDLDSDFLRTLGITRYNPPIKPVIGNVVAGSPAERAGLQPGDLVKAINNVPVETWEKFVSVIRAHPGASLVMEIDRAGAQVPAIAITPDEISEGGNSVGRIGASPRVDRDAFAHLTVEVRYGPIDSLTKAVSKTWDTSVFSLQMLGKMIVGEISLKNLSGPITIADYAGQSAQNGWISYLLFLALISISLGVLNLLPVPLLDGGHLMYYMLEVFKGRPVSEKAIEIGQQVGMALLFVLMAFAIYNDINRLISG